MENLNNVWEENEAIKNRMKKAQLLISEKWTNLMIRRSILTKRLSGDQAGNSELQISSPLRGCVQKQPMGDCRDHSCTEDDAIR